MDERVVLIGAGSASFTRGLLADVIRQGWRGEVALVDVDSDALAVAERLARKMIEARRAPLTLRASTDRREVLKRATAVICTIGVGGRRAWERDVFIPRTYGIYQPVGDTVMPGGTSRALRMIPAMVEIARDVLDLAPEALFFNYGNPMTPLCRAVRKATGADMVGLCHGVLWVAGRLADVLGVSRGALQYAARGVNHLTWFTEVRADGRDAMDTLRAIARDKLGGGGASGSPPPDLDDPFTWQCMELFGAFPAVLDRHITEFFPQMFAREGAYYGRTLGVEAFSFEDCIAGGDEGFRQMREVAASPDPLPEDYFERIGGEHEQVTEIIESIRRDAGKVFSANLPNRGQIPNLPGDIIVEAPAAAGAGGMQPLAGDPLAAALAGTLATRVQWVETVVEAALEGSREKFVQALLIDGAVDSVQTACALADDLLAAQAEHLPQFARRPERTAQC